MKKYTISVDLECTVEAENETKAIETAKDMIAKGMYNLEVVDVEEEEEEAKKRLEYLRGEIEAERISYAEIAELQSLSEFIEPGDALLLEWAGRIEDAINNPDDTEALGEIEKVIAEMRGK